MIEVLLAPFAIFLWLVALGGFLGLLLAPPVGVVVLAVKGVRHLRARAVAQQTARLELRAGDADRAWLAAQLREHYASGRLTLPELEERLDAVHAAKTPRALRALLADLPAPAPLAAAAAVRPWLRRAAAYNLAWGGAVAAFGPGPAWRCVGMLVLVWAPAYLWASLDPLRHAHVVAVAMIGKILGPLGFLAAVAVGALPPAFAVVILANDVIWWPAFGRFLAAAARAAGGWRALLGGASVSGSVLAALPPPSAPRRTSPAG